MKILIMGMICLLGLSAGASTKLNFNTINENFNNGVQDYLSWAGLKYIEDASVRIGLFC